MRREIIGAEGIEALGGACLDCSKADQLEIYLVWQERLIYYIIYIIQEKAENIGEEGKLKHKRSESSL